MISIERVTYLSLIELFFNYFYFILLTLSFNSFTFKMFKIIFIKLSNYIWYLNNMPNNFYNLNLLLNFSILRSCLIGHSKKFKSIFQLFTHV